MRIMSIDPSVNHIGIAYIINGRYETSLSFKTDEEKNTEGKLKEISEHFSNLQEKADIVIVEHPTFMKMGGDRILNMWSLMTLCMSIGAIVGALSNRYEVEFVKVNEWKGRTKKKYTQKSVEYIIGKKLNDHEADAVMMGINFYKSIMFKHAVKRGIERASR